MCEVLVSFPDDAYLKKVGRIAYAVSNIEGEIIYDLPRLSAFLPEGLGIDDLVVLPTGTIAEQLREQCNAIVKSSVKDYVKRVADALGELAGLRNDLLHARPATHPSGAQMLLRTKVKGRKPTGKTVWIDSTWFRNAERTIGLHQARIKEVRPSFEEYPSF